MYSDDNYKMFAKNISVSQSNYFGLLMWYKNDEQGKRSVWLRLMGLIETWDILKNE